MNDEASRAYRRIRRQLGPSAGRPRAPQRLDRAPPRPAAMQPGDRHSQNTVTRQAVLCSICPLTTLDHLTVASARRFLLAIAFASSTPTPQLQRSLLPVFRFRKVCPCLASPSLVLCSTLFSPCVFPAADDLAQQSKRVLERLAVERGAPPAPSPLTPPTDGPDNDLSDGVCNDGTGVCTLRASDRAGELRCLQRRRYQFQLTSQQHYQPRHGPRFRRRRSQHQWPQRPDA